MRLIFIDSCMRCYCEIAGYVRGGNLWGPITGDAMTRNTRDLTEDDRTRWIDRLARAGGDIRRMPTVQYTGCRATDTAQ